MLTEQHGKGGQLCRQARTGQIHCPLIVRPTSEDVVTGHVVEALRRLNAYWWLPELLNTALGDRRFRRQVHRRLRIEPWVNQPLYPRELLPWAEGSTQVDVCLRWENEPTTVFVEAKYGSAVAATTTHGDGTLGFPADQIIRNVRVGLAACGYLDAPDPLIRIPPRDFVMILLAPTRGHPLIERYRDPANVRDAIPHAERLVGLPRSPWVGELGYADVIEVLRRQSRWLTRAERSIVESLTSYLEFKLAKRPGRSSSSSSSETPTGSSRVSPGT